MNQDKKDKNYKMLSNYKLHLSIFIIYLISEYIGIHKISVFGKFTIIILPMIYALTLAILTYTTQWIIWIGKNESIISNSILILLIGPLIAKISIISGSNFNTLLNVGPLILLEELGDLGAILLGLPIALLLGFKRESIGMTSSICREPQMAVILDKYGMNSKESKGFLAVYLIGTIIGTVLISLIIPVLSYIIPLHPYAYAIGCGIGSSSMNVAGTTTLTTMYPNINNNILAFSGIANIISSIFSIYLFIFISLPLTEYLYKKLEAKLSKK